MYLGIDIGTTATKALLVDADQRVVASRSLSHATLQTGPGLSEQEPDSWIDAVAAVLLQLRSDASRAYDDITQIGLSGQMHSLVAVDARDRPVRPAILWNDARGQEECLELEKLVPDLARISGAAAMPSFTATKLRWLKHHEPAAFERTRCILLPKDYVRLWLTGERVTDPSDAAGTQMFDQRRRTWSESIVTAMDIDPEVLPPIREGSSTAGGLRTSAAARLGMKAGIPVAVGGGDVGTGALGIGCVREGDRFISLGTSATFIVVQERYEPGSTGFLHDFAHCVPDRWYRMAAMLNGASCLAWVARVVGATDIGALLMRIEASYGGPSRIMFVPYLSGERTPYNNSTVRGAFVGLDASTDALDMVQAVLEGVAFSLRDALLALGTAGERMRDVSFIGGGARSLLWSKIIANALGRPILRLGGAELGSALGAARLAMLSAGGVTLAAIATPPKVDSVVEPDPDLVTRYAERHAAYRAFYPALANYGSEANPSD